jgi:hypothetical protein
LSSTEKSQIEFALCTSQNKEKLQWWVIYSSSCGQGKLNYTRLFWHLFLSLGQKLSILLGTFVQWAHI